MVELRLNKQEDLQNCSNPFDSSLNYQKVITFAAEDLKERLTDYTEKNKLGIVYVSALKKMNTATTEERYLEAEKEFETIAEYKDSAELAKKCHENAEIAKEKAEEKRIMVKKARIEQERKAEEQRILAEQKKKRNKKIAIIVCAVIAFIIVLNNVIIPNNKYNKAVSALNNKEYEKAISLFEEIVYLKDSKEVIYNEAKKLVELGNEIDALNYSVNLTTTKTQLQ